MSIRELRRRAQSSRMGLRKCLAVLVLLVACATVSAQGNATSLICMFDPSQGYEVTIDYSRNAVKVDAIDQGGNPRGFSTGWRTAGFSANQIVVNHSNGPHWQRYTLNKRSAVLKVEQSGAYGRGALNPMFTQQCQEQTNLIR